MTSTVAHPVDVISNDAPVTIPFPRTPDMDWPGDSPVVHVPAALMLAATGRCSCDNCLDGFVRLLARSRMRAV
ncbi:MAG: hypothetical protein JWO12_92 [Frankiales bacterium]|nr:hypothetical protein [Frankiales bacterium]